MKIKDRLEERAFDAFSKGNALRYFQKNANQVLLDKVIVHVERKK